MSKPENVFIDGVHKHMPPLSGVGAGRPYREKMHNPLRGGTWDVYYSGSKSELWVEYKFIELPTRASTVIVPALTPLQVQWGRGRGAEGRQLAVIVGSKAGGVIFENYDWECGVSAAVFAQKLLDRKRLAEYIIALTQGTK